MIKIFKKIFSKKSSGTLIQEALAAIREGRHEDAFRMLLKAEKIMKREGIRNPEKEMLEIFIPPPMTPTTPMLRTVGDLKRYICHEIVMAEYIHLWFVVNFGDHHDHREENRIISKIRRVSAVGNISLDDLDF